MIFSSVYKYLNIFDFSLEIGKNIVNIGFFENVLAYTIQNGIIFLIMDNSNIKIITINRNTTPITYSAIDSIEFSDSYLTNLLGISFLNSSTLILHD